MSDKAAREEAERRWPALQPDAEVLTYTYPRSAIREFARVGFITGADWQAAQPVVVSAEGDAVGFDPLIGLHAEDWTDALRGEPPSCACGFNGTPTECLASRLARLAALNVTVEAETRG